MTEWKGADPPISLVLIHRVITHGLEVGMRHAASFARDGYAGPAEGAGFALYLRTLAGVLFQHHSAEDKIAFPFLRERLPGRRRWASTGPKAQLPIQSPCCSSSTTYPLKTG